ncbi:hexose kinase [Vagococcus sp. BWB3-3]|uniref:Tagatose-6-phosphate kinase n=1 Tax=Vagococcus allomyrinae TaxID=2794353 RepID=A0A940ST81_9ENTE|nr:hexose kinase [Vagococcus allomyrinae]MBP1040035.1 hexose kinase [Vagococcus allomyrinae]
MILTVTLNPSVDIAYPLDSLTINQVNRCPFAKKTAGGKGLNVTRVIQQMAVPVTATGFLGGPLGIFIKEQLANQQINQHFATIQDETRNCIAILHDNGQQTEILETGPMITPAELAEFEKIVTTEAKQAAVVTLSGSLPKGAPHTYYAQLLTDLKDTSAKVILDTSGESLKAVLVGNIKPYAIKPNLDELTELTGKKSLLDDLQLIKTLSQPLFEGIPLILVSLGNEGAFVKFNEAFYRVKIPKIKVVNPVGSGDSTVAGLAIALARGAEIDETLKTAMTLGMLNALESQTGAVNPLNFDTYFKQIVVIKQSGDH